MNVARLLLVLFLCLPLTLRAQTPQAKSFGTASTEWPGVHFDLAKITRLDETHILVAVRIRGDATVKNPTMISGQDRSTMQNPDNIDPFTLAAATLIDEATGKTYKADVRLPGSPYWGDPDIIANIRPNTWFQLAIKFEVPPPILTPKGEKEEQKVTFHLPRAKTPIKDVVLP